MVQEANSSGFLPETYKFILNCMILCRKLDEAKFMDVEIAVRALYMLGEAMSVRFF